MNNPFNTIKHWDEKWDSKGTGGDYGKKQYLFLEKLFPPKKVFTCLDVACGKGIGIKHLKDKFPNGIFHGIDFSSKAISHANNNYADTTELSYETVDIYKYDSKGFKFDYIIMIEILEHIRWPEKIVEKYLEICNKVIYISVPAGNRPFKEHLFAYGNMGKFLEKWDGKRIGEQAGRTKWQIEK